MKIVLATGIYPPDIGGPATYSHALAEQLHAKGHDVVVIAYLPLHGRERRPESRFRVVDVDRGGGARARWKKYAAALRSHASDADIVYAFSSVSCGIPLRMARLKKPKKILRLGGDFFWERYTARGGDMGLASWYGSFHWLKVVTHGFMARLLRSFDHIVFSTKFQESLYESRYKALPPHCVIENAVPAGSPMLHEPHEPFRILFMGRFVGFKHLPSLIHAMTSLPSATLTLTGEGPMSLSLIALVSELALNDRVTFVSPVREKEKDAMLDDHDLLVIPSTTEISPNVALEARSRGLPVLLTEHTGLDESLSRGMQIASLDTSARIADAVRVVQERYADVATEAMQPLPSRLWERVADEHLVLFSSL